MRFEWDAEKSATNALKHGIDFQSAVRVFGDPQLVIREDRTDLNGEVRWHAIGMTGESAPLLLVVHVYREAIDGEEITRIISARKASKRESRGYFQ
jgi:uncharacterized protein